MLIISISDGQQKNFDQYVPIEYEQMRFNFSYTNALVVNICFPFMLQSLDPIRQNVISSRYDVIIWISQPINFLAHVQTFLRKHMQRI